MFQFSAAARAAGKPALSAAASAAVKVRLPLARLLPCAAPEQLHAPPAPAPCFTCVLQAAATVCIKDKPDVWKAAENGDIELVPDHVTADPTCVHEEANVCDARQCVRRPPLHAHLKSACVIAVFVSNVFILFFVSGQGLLCIGLLAKAASKSADCSLRQEPTSTRKAAITSSSTPALSCAFENAGLIAVFCPSFPYLSLLQFRDPSAFVFSLWPPRCLSISCRFGSRCQCERQRVRRPPLHAHLKMWA